METQEENKDKLTAYLKLKLDWLVSWMKLPLEYRENHLTFDVIKKETEEDGIFIYDAKLNIIKGNFDDHPK